MLGKGSDTWVSVAGKLTSRVRAVLAGGAADVVRAAWLRALPPAPTPAALAPLHMLALAPATRLALARHYDPYGDSYTEPIDEATLKMCFEKMDTDVSDLKRIYEEIPNNKKCLKKVYTLSSQKSTKSLILS